MPERRWILPAAVTGVGAFYLALFALAPAHLPALIGDSGDYLGIARWIAGAGRTPQLVGEFHSFGYGAVLAPAYLFTEDITAIYHYAIAINVVAGAALVLPLRALASEGLGSSRGWATAAAVAGAAYSGIALQVGEVWPVALLALGSTWFALLLVRLRPAATVSQSASIALLAVVLFALHHRMAPLAGVAAVVLLRAWFMGARRAATIGGIVLIAGLLVVVTVDNAVIDALYPAGTDRTGVGDGLRPSAFGHLGRVLTGEAWYALVAGFGLAALGGTAFCRGRAKAGPVPGRLFVAAAAGTAVLGALQLAGAGAFGVLRLDYDAYGRYVDPYLPVLVAAGVAALATSTRRSLLSVAYLLVGATVLECLVQGATDPPGQYVKATLPGVLGAAAFFGHGGAAFGVHLPIAGIGLVATVAAVAIALVRRARTVAAAGLAAAALAALGVVGAADGLRAFHRRVDRAYARLPGALERYGPRVTVGFLAEAEPEVAMYRVEMRAPDRPVVLVTPAASQPHALPPLLVAPAGWPPARTMHARQVVELRTNRLQPQALYELRSISSIR